MPRFCTWAPPRARALTRHIIRYDIVQTQALQSTSYTVSWLRPDYDESGASSTVQHKLLLGTQYVPCSLVSADSRRLWRHT